MSDPQGPEQGKDPVIGRVVAVLAIDDVEAAHRRAFDMALDACEGGKTVAHLHADPQVRTITFDPDGTHDLANAITTIPTSSGRLIRIAIGGLARQQVSDIVASVRPLVDGVLLSGPEPALTQMSLEFATLADSAVCVGGTEADAARLWHVLDELGIGHAHSAPPSTRSTSASTTPGSAIPGSPGPEISNPKIMPPGRL